jgi:NAD(P)-dependent dehydrogenase (short-subunit alcohol dehydrogenase family)
MPTTPMSVVLTGGGSGLGRVIARTMVEAGHHVLVAGRTGSSLAETVATCSGPGSIESVVADVTDAASVDALFGRAEDRWGRLDVLVNNAGTFGPTVPFDEVPEEDWRATLDTNTTGAFLCARAAFRLMKRQHPRGGRIINNGSISAQTPRPHSAAYSASKHAVTGLTKAISLDGREHGIACGQIDIGNASTDMTAAMGRGVRQADGSIRPEATMDAQHAADAVLYMAGLPLEANVQFLTVTATTMPFIGRG